MNNKVVLGISGGIDSAVSALLLKQKGMDVYALYFDVKGLEGSEEQLRAESICKQLNISLNYVNIKERFEKIIIEPFCLSYMGGCTPSPCVWCNPYIKWFILKEYADEIGADYLATGHYARIANENGVCYVKKSANRIKDQSYMLAMLGQDILSGAIFPLGDFESKDDVRNFAKKNGLIFSDDLKESQDICFIDKDYKTLLKDRGYISKPGNFVDENGNVIGSHKAFSDFTIGQGKGFGMGFNKKMYVKSINPDTGDVMLCEDESLYTSNIKITVQNFAKYGLVNYIPEEYEGKSFVTKIRYAAPGTSAVLRSCNNEPGIAELIFASPQRAPAPGQFAVFYENDLVVGCGIIS